MQDRREARLPDGRGEWLPSKEEQMKLFNELAKILKAEKIRRSPSNLHTLITGNWWLEGDYPQLDELQISSRQLDLDDWSVFKPAYDAYYGKRKVSSTPPEVIEVYVGDLLEETDKAYGFFSGKMLGPSRPYILWVPKSQVTYNERGSILTMPIWLAIEKNWMSAS